MTENEDHSRDDFYSPDACSVDIIFHNVNVDSNFRTTRTQRWGTLEGQMGRFMGYIRAGCFEQILSVAASKYSFVVVVATTLSRDELRARGFPG